MTQIIRVSTKSKKRKNLTAKQRKLKQEWEEMLSRHTSKCKPQAKVNVPTGKIMPNFPVGYRSTKQYKSLGDGCGNASKSEPKVYTGNQMIGISIIHKSCLQPVFSKNEAVDAANMRR